MIIHISKKTMAHGISNFEIVFFIFVIHPFSFFLIISYNMLIINLYIKY